ncbi:AAA family ATPase [Novosphingobium sp. SL115]|uniref:AAA family ATPase n=1 Tax=Novosphingobium sp. SL115 TaxID=2995150 RepID=UPI002276C40F|nr:AAA family ATPase [Novosphingobium sp. SL115]MCY1669587.1 AAA family ATPase [Novosphingobium sp. SL115]
MTGVRIAKMRVQAFRGITEAAEFDFSSPLTLVFAANGTGKTTMCEAAEWLLTGQVERLRDKGHFDQMVLFPKFSQSDRAPMVDADLHLRGKPKRLQRVVVGNETQARMSGDDGLLGPIVGLNDMLGRLAPAAAAEDAHHLRAISLRQGWLRGTRFLSAEALATLVDSDDNTIERRKDVFADLLGVRHLLEAEKLANRYIAEIGGRERLLTQTIAGRDEEIVRLTVELQSAPSSAAISAEAEVANAERRLGLVPVADEQSSLAARIEALDVERHRRQHILVTRREAIETSATRWSERAQLSETIAGLEAAYPALAKTVAEIVQQGQAASAAVAAATTHCDALKADLRTLEAARAKMVPLVSAFYRALFELPEANTLNGTMTIAQLINHLPQAIQDSATIAQLQADVGAALAEERDAGDADRRIVLLKAQLTEARSLAPSEEALARLREAADRLDAEAQRTKQLHEATAGPLARLQTAGRELVGHQHSSGATDCPLCSHDWKSADALRDAVNATLAAVPEVERLAQQAAAASSEAARLARARFEEAQRQSAQVERLRAELTNLERDAEARKSKLTRLGIEVTDRAAGLKRLAQALLAASALAELLRERDRVSTTLPGSGAPLLGDRATLATLEVNIDGPIREREALVRDTLAHAEAALAEHAAKRDALRKEHAVAAEAVRANRDVYARQQGELEKLRQLWRSAALDAKWTEANLAAARAWARGEQALLEDVAARTVAAQAAWNAEVRRTRLDALRREVEPLRARLDHISKRIAAAHDARSAFHDSYVHISGRQIDDLGRVVNPLFARMHANRVFDRIKLGQVDDPLRWLADAGGQELNPGKDFSQGQRQDLALALFLARARSLGGTFFLDEPVTHLDDLNRVGLLDIFRATVLENSMSLNLVVTTASKPLARHLIEKFGRVGPVDTPGGRAAPLRVIELDGNGRTGVRLQTVY